MIKLKESELKRMIYESVKNAMEQNYSDEKLRKSAERYANDPKYRDNLSSWLNKDQVDFNNQQMTMPWYYDKISGGLYDKIHDVGYDARQIPPYEGDEETDKLNKYAADYRNFSHDTSKWGPGHVDYVYNDIKNESKLRKMVEECVRMALKGKRF